LLTKRRKNVGTGTASDYGTAQENPANSKGSRAKLMKYKNKSSAPRRFAGLSCAISPQFGRAGVEMVNALAHRVGADAGPGAGL
jgi:hypothetical protein